MQIRNGRREVLKNPNIHSYFGAEEEGVGCHCLFSPTTGTADGYDGGTTTCMYRCVGDDDVVEVKLRFSPASQCENERNCCCTINGQYKPPCLSAIQPASQPAGRPRNVNKDTQ